MVELNTRSDFGKFLKERGLDAYPAAEVGVAEGFYSLEILEWGIPRVYMVDAWETVPGFPGGLSESQELHDRNFCDCMERVKPYMDRVVVLRGMTVEMADEVPDGLLGFIHLDATHTYESTLADLQAWYPKLVPGGIMSGHDYLNPDWGVNQAVTEFAADVGARPHAIDVERTEHACFWFEREDR
jgi:hypothetical protein